MKMLPVKNVFSARIVYYNFLQTSMYVSHHHFLSIVIVFTCSLASSLFVASHAGVFRGARILP